MRARYYLPVLGVVAALATQAQAGFLSVNWDLSEADGNHWNTGSSTTPSNGGDAWAWDHFDNLTSGSETLSINGQTNSDPVLFISETVVNDTGIPWIGYSLDTSVSPGTVTFVNPGSTSATPFTMTSFSSTHIDFGAPGGPVGFSQSVTLNFYVNIATTGLFSLTIVQGPILAPEPASLGVLAVGSLALLRRRR